MNIERGRWIEFRHGDHTLKGVVEGAVDAEAKDTTDENEVVYVRVGGPEYGGYVHITNVIEE